MSKLPSLKKKICVITPVLIAGFSLLYAQEASAPEATPTQNRGVIESHNIPEKKKGTVIFDAESQSPAAYQESQRELTELQKQARDYRKQGLEMQNLGNLDAAASFYQKALQLDPGYVVPYNDLGVIYEAAGAIDRAEESYFKAIQINPKYLSPYSNLALLYENKRDLQKAAVYWKKRADLGAPEEAWTQKALQRFKDINVVVEGKPLDTREKEVIGLTKDILNQKALEKESNPELAKTKFKKALIYFNKGDDVSALREAVDAQILDPDNPEIEEFVEKVQKRLLSK
jgi:Flp pilus assembly protein TadD